MNRQLLGLTGALLASVAVALPASTANTNARMTAKQAALKGMVAPSSAAPEQMVSRLIVKLRSPSASELVSPMSASRMQALSASAGVGMKSVRAMAGSASLLALDTPLPLSEAKAVAARLARDPSVEYAEPDIMLKKFATPNDTRFNDWQWNLFAPTSTYTGALTGGGTLAATATGGANLQLAWDVTTGHSSVVLAVIDTGIVNHQDLNGAGISPFSETYVPNGRFLAGYDFISEGVGAGTLPANFVSNDGDGRDANPSDPGDWVTTAEEGLYPSLCDDGNRWTAEQQLARQSYGGCRGRDSRQCDRYCRHRLERANSSGARARQVWRFAIGHCRSDSLGSRTASAWSADQYDASAGDQP